MYINERGQVNYHSFLKALRERNKALTSVASKGSVHQVAVIDLRMEIDWARS